MPIAIKISEANSNAVDVKYYLELAFFLPPYLLLFSYYYAVAKK